MKSVSKKLPLIYPDAAGIDIGSEKHYVCVPADRDTQSVKKFGCFTQDLYSVKGKIIYIVKAHENSIARRRFGLIKRNAYFLHFIH